jgi:hypothetical protein
MKAGHFISKLQLFDGLTSGDIVLKTPSNCFPLFSDTLALHPYIQNLIYYRFETRIVFCYSLWTAAYFLIH